MLLRPMLKQGGAALGSVDNIAFVLDKDGENPKAHDGKLVTCVLIGVFLH